MIRLGGRCKFFLYDLIWWGREVDVDGCVLTNGRWRDPSLKWNGDEVVEAEHFEGKKWEQ